MKPVILLIILFISSCKFTPDQNYKYVISGCPVNGEYWYDMTNEYEINDCVITFVGIGNKSYTLNLDLVCSITEYSD